MSNQDLNSTEIQNPITKLGEFGVEGGPGRPKGLKNKYTLIKEQLLEVWDEENGQQKFRELFRGSSRDYVKALEIIVALLPKEPPGTTVIEDRSFTVCWGDPQK